MTKLKPIIEKVLIISAFIGFFILLSVKTSKQPAKISCDVSAPRDDSTSHKKEVDYFYEMAYKYRVDKVTVHAYHHVYGLYLGPLKEKQIYLLEIGLGCGQPYGTGKSLELWKEYFPYGHISIIEFDKKCANEYAKNAFKMFAGDQTDMDFLLKVRNNGDVYDVIIDDGGHSKKMQIHSLIGLWPILKPEGGVYVIEDVHFHDIELYNDLNVKTVEVMFYLINKINKYNATLANKWVEKQLEAIYPSILSINCFPRACVLIKRNV